MWLCVCRSGGGVCVALMPMTSCTSEFSWYLFADEQPCSARDPTMIFTAEQVACMCEVLLQSGRVEHLEGFLHSLPPLFLSSCPHPGELESVLKAKAAVAFPQGCFADLYALLEGFPFSPRSQPFLQQLWIRAHYTEAAEGTAPGSRGEVPNEEKVSSS